MTPTGAVKHGIRPTRGACAPRCVVSGVSAGQLLPLEHPAGHRRARLGYYQRAAPSAVIRPAYSRVGAADRDWRDRVSAQVGPASGQREVIPDAPQRDEYVPVDLRSLQSDSSLPFDLYQRLHGMNVLYRHRDRPFDAITRARLMGNGVDYLWVAAADEQRLGSYYEEHLESLVHNRTIPVAVRARVLRSATYNLASELLGQPASGAVTRAESVVEHLARFATGEVTAVRDLIGLADVRRGLHVHSANTAVFTLTIALASDIEDIDVLANAAVAGLVHDVGLTKVPPEILLKSDGLTDGEREVISRHPGAGEEILATETSLPEDIREAVYCHHERSDGSGYPDGLREADIPWLARMVAVAEVFDSLTSNQPWRPRVRPFDAAKYMLTHVGLDPTYVRRLVRALRA